MSLKVLAVLLCLAWVPLADSKNYCKIKCPVGTRHSACDSNCKPAPHVRIIHQTLEFRKTILDIHNRLRDEIASGRDTTGGNSQAANMAVLSYDMDLEFTVSCWLYQTGDVKHDRCRGTTKFPSAGQNLIKTKQFDPSTEYGVKQVVMTWFNEVKHFAADQVDKFTNDGITHRTIDNYTQIIWAETTHLGCARCHTGGGYYMVGCNYGPGGNQMHSRIYIRGRPASMCKDDIKPNMKYRSLCGEVEPMPAAAELRGHPDITGVAPCPPRLQVFLYTLLLLSLSFW